MQNLGTQVPTKQAPRGAIPSRSNIMLITTQKLRCRWGNRTVGENGAVFDKSSVGQGVGVNENGSAGPNFKSDDGTVLEFEVVQDLFDVGE